MIQPKILVQSVLLIPGLLSDGAIGTLQPDRPPIRAAQSTPALPIPSVMEIPLTSLPHQPGGYPPHHQKDWGSRVCHNFILLRKQYTKACGSMPNESASCSIFIWESGLSLKERGMGEARSPRGGEVRFLADAVMKPEPLPPPQRAGGEAILRWSRPFSAALRVSCSAVRQARPASRPRPKAWSTSPRCSWMVALRRS